MNDAERSNKVYQWARQQLNKRVGVGECWDLADRALRQAGARTSTTTGPDDNYDWGTPVNPVQAVIPGDILQFRNYMVDMRHARQLDRERLLALGQIIVTDDDGEVA